MLPFSNRNHFVRLGVPFGNCAYRRVSQEQWGRGRHLIIDTQGVAMVKRAPFGKDEGRIRLALSQIMDESVAAFSLEQKRRG